MRSERIDLQSLRAKIRQAMGKERSGSYFELLRRYVAGELTKRELDVHAASLLGGGSGGVTAADAPIPGDMQSPGSPMAGGGPRNSLIAASRGDFLALHNLFMKSILHNAACAEGPPLSASSAQAPVSFPGNGGDLVGPGHVDAGGALQNPQLAAMRALQQQQQPGSGTSASSKSRSQVSKSSKSTKSSKRDKKTKKTKKMKKSSSGTSSSASNRGTAAQQAQAVVAARQVQVEQAKIQLQQQQLQQQKQQQQKQQQQQQQQQLAQRMRPDLFGGRAAWMPNSAEQRELFGSRPELHHRRISHQTSSHSAIRQRMSSVVMEFAANVQTPGILRDWPEIRAAVEAKEGGRRNSSSGSGPVNEDDAELLLSHVSNDAVCLVHDALFEHLRQILTRLAASKCTLADPGGVKRPRDLLTNALGGNLASLPEEEDGSDANEPRTKRRRAGAAQISRLDLHRFATRDQSAQILFGDDRERLLEKTSILL